MLTQKEQINNLRSRLLSISEERVFGLFEIAQSFHSSHYIAIPAGNIFMHSL